MAYTIRLTDNGLELSETQLLPLYVSAEGRSVCVRFGFKDTWLSAHEAAHLGEVILSAAKKAKEEA